MENNILHIAIENLKETSGIFVFLQKENTLERTIEFQLNDQKIKLVANVITEVRPHQLPQIEEEFRLKKNYIVVAQKISPSVKEMLRTRAIPYLEANGNVFLNQQGIYVWLEKEKALPIRKENRNKAFTKSGLRVVYQLLTYPNIINDTYRNIADKAGVALGNIPLVFESLRENGYLLKKDKDTFILDKKKELLGKWVDAYAMKLKPSLKKGEFGIKNGDHWRTIKLVAQDSVWGGESAGEYLTNYLRAEKPILYTSLGKNELIKKYGLIPEKGGFIEVFDKFWKDLPINDLLVEKLPITSPILIYADLVQTGDKRCLDTAKMIFDEHIQQEL